ncbi:hypothetical protein CA13_09220 [Planctomycetes bacterium CA13]|uniref:Uncharacterized protein n=1 Tax=Novipirellula herctigrandis TaxID=2527986 RepID=A0A5C5YWV0_9BACT|nr:hypothetical protein CA13_09220 [Planctomycetes bacterium CA13]
MPSELPQHYIGQLEIRDDGVQVLHRTNWTAIAETNPDLVEPPPRMARNPATGKPMLLQPHMLPRDYRVVQLGDEFIGSFEWSFYEYDTVADDDLGVVLVSAAQGHEDAIRSMAVRFAATMNAQFTIDHSLVLGKRCENVAEPRDAPESSS